MPEPRLFKKEEFMNSHGIFINDLIGTDGENDFERAKKANIRNKIKNFIHTIDLEDEKTNQKIRSINVIVWKNKSEHKEMTGWVIELYNEKGERFNTSWPNFIDKDIESIREYISEELN